MANMNKPITDGCNLRIKYMHGSKICTIIDVDDYHGKVFIENKTDDPMQCAFGVVENPGWKDYETFLKDRVFPRERAGIRLILQNLGLDWYEPLLILEKTNGRCAEDNMWMIFEYAEDRAE